MKTTPPIILPGETVGILGGGQLGRMFAIAARRMGYRVHTFEPHPDSPAGQVSDKEVVAPYDDLDAVRAFARGVSAMSFEFENIPHDAIQAAAEICPVRPGANVLHICQNREREKRFLEKQGFPCAPFAIVDSADALASALEKIGIPSVLKTADFGYDGKGQLKITERQDPETLWKTFSAPRAVLEKWIPFEAELSVIVARGLHGGMVTFPPSENIHTNHILDLSIVPARFSPDVLDQAVAIAGAVAESLEVVGLLAVEMFLSTSGELLINELAPRPHNSGHFSFDACVTSQFEQQLRAVCGLPLGSTKLLSPVVMLNLLGDLWSEGEPDWPTLLANPTAKLHLYGKSEPRPGRKMGHVCFLDEIPPALASAKIFGKT
ncbi:MAG: 5-(carboxyamino)imidazole ribonucleotide synthase [Terrimicrobiaceae bacterium]